MPAPKPTKPTAIIHRGSTLVISLPDIGAVMNWQTPVTNIVLPIISGE